MNSEIRLVKDDAQGVTRVYFSDGEKKTELGSIAFDTREFTVCPDLANPETVIPGTAKLLGIASESLSSFTVESGLLLVGILLL